MSVRGKRVRYVIVEEKTVDKDDYGQPVEEWNPATGLSETDADGGIYAEEHHKGGDEGVEDGQILAWNKVIWKINPISSLNAKDYRFTYDGKIYDIETIWPIRRHSQMVKTTQKDNQ